VFHLWQTNFKKKYPSFDNFLQTLKLTLRDWKNDTDFIYALKYFTWTLGININILTFTKCRHIFNCSFHSDCSLIIYKFQNSFMKIFNNPNLKSINFFFYKNNLFQLNTSSHHLHPYLINQLLFENLIFNNTLITIADLLLIINQTFTGSFPFSIKIFTSYSFVSTRCTTQITNNFIGDYQSSQSDETVWIFLNPWLDPNKFSICLLSMDQKTKLTFSKKNFFSTVHVNEGTKIADIKNQQLNEQATILNQEYCICEHPLTQIVHSKLKNLNTKHLASPMDQKYFLLENLGKSHIQKI